MCSSDVNHIIHVKVVPQTSAVVPGAINADALELYKDHASLVKFDSEHDGDFLVVSGQLHLMARQATVAIKKRWDEQGKRMLV